MKRWLPLAALSAAPAWGAQVDDDESGSAVDPNSPCPSAKPQSPQCCFNSTAVVAGGVDFVDLAGKTQGKDAPRIALRMRLKYERCVCFSASLIFVSSCMVKKDVV